MKKISFVFLLVLAMFLNINASPSGKQPIFVTEFIGQMDFVKGRLTQLAEVMPESKFSWAPAEGVRNVGEVYSHVAEANYYLISVIKNEKPDMDQDKKELNKAEIIEMLKNSFDAVKEAAAKLSDDDLNREVEAFGMKFSLRNFMITLLNHSHEHLGQGIAYARMNGVTPPWSMKE